MQRAFSARVYLAIRIGDDPISRCLRAKQQNEKHFKWNIVKLYRDAVRVAQKRFPAFTKKQETSESK